MPARRPSAKFALFVALLAAVAPLAQADGEDRSAGIRQVTKGDTLAERSSAAFDQISTVQSGRSRLDQIDPSLALKDGAEIDRLSASEPPQPVEACTLTPEQQSIVTSLEAQGKLPAGECELVAWFARPGDKVENDDRQALAEAAVSGAPELLGVETEAGRLAQQEAEAEQQRQQADAAAAAMALSILAPQPSAAPGN